MFISRQIVKVFSIMAATIAGALIAIIMPGIVGAQSPDSAANNATKPAQCYVSLLGNNTSTDCSTVSFLPPGTQTTVGKCYDVIASGSGFGVNEVSCNQPVFNPSGNFTSVKCADGSFQTGNNQTSEQLCELNGGTAEATKILQDNVDNPDREKNINCNGPQECFENNSLVSMLKLAINLVSAAVGVIITVVIIWAGIEYSSAGGDPNRTAQAKKRIINAIIALVSYIFLWAFLQWLVPGSPF